MDSIEAVRAAKGCVRGHFSDEGLTSLGLEEIDFAQGGIWKITIGFSRPWNKKISAALVGETADRTYKTVQINDDDGRIMSIRDRQLSP